MSRYLRVRNWDKFQQYKDREPKWIKLHRGLLRDYEFGSLSDQAKGHLICLWLLAAETDNRIPNDPEWVRQQCQLKSKPDLNQLVTNGFLEPYSSVQICTEGCEGVSDSVPREETEERQIREETEERERGRVAPSPARGTRLSSDWDLPVEWGQWAEEQGMSRDNIIRECDKFKDYWISKSGSQATKTDWQATWRNWVRRHLEEYAA